MTREDDFSRGMRQRRAVLGDEWVEASSGSATAFNEEFLSLITRYAWNEIWGRPGLDETTRRLLALAMTMAMGRWEEFEVHIAAAIRSKVPTDMLKELLLQGAIYCGVPAANSGFKIAMHLLDGNQAALRPTPLSDNVRVKTHYTFSAPQLKIAIQGPETGTPVVFSHSLGLDLKMWDATAQRLATLGPVLRYDHRGHGGSQQFPSSSMTDFVDDAARVVGEWGRGPVIFVGLSLGGMVGMGLAIHHPHLVRGLVIANTAAAYGAVEKEAWARRIEAVEAGGMGPIVDQVVDRYLTREFQDANPSEATVVRDTLVRTPRVGYQEACRAVMNVDFMEVLGSIKTPTLVIAGDKDIATPVASCAQIASLIPNARFEVIGGASHLSSVEQSDEFLRLTEAFVADLTTDSRASNGG